MPVKIAALDFDGTLHRGGTIAPQDIAAIDAWRKAGHLAISATGRSRSSLTRGLTGLNRTFDYNVLSNGGSSTDAENNLLFGHPLPSSAVRTLVSTFHQLDGLAVYGTTLGDNDGVFSNNTGQKRNKLTEGFIEMTVDDIPFHDFAVVPFWVPTDMNLREIVIDWIRKHLPHVAITTNHNFIDIMAAGVNKGSGIQQLLAYLGINDYELYTFGDSWNDIPMHEIAHRSHSFDFSPTDVKDASHQVIRRVSDCLMDYA
ncbi:HAD family hydrolase [Corynebacterium breve]|uniref:HAD family hydrolase n=1 Tax=Corynebacterium breve TaxID=3049799 RepID=A0ABY8VIW1_9CORY|nr:HAD family hydrolase [Corynebacterium breve]WIM68178.1 HAD family hydrolase [Corynebacterium breve]